MKLLTNQRINEKYQLCFNCLKTGHRSNDCTTSHCRKCPKKHNTIFHREETANTSNEVAKAVTFSNTLQKKEVAVNVSCNYTQNTETTIMLAIAMMSLADSKVIMVTVELFLTEALNLIS